MLRFLFLIFLYVCAHASTFAQSSDYEAYVQRGLTAAEHDSLEQAEEYFRQALRVSPADYRNSLIFTNLGKIQELRYWRNPQQHQLADQALENYTLAINLIPTSVPMLDARGSFYMKLKNYAKAVNDFTTILDLAPTNHIIRNHRAYCYVQLRRYDEGKVDYLRVLEQDAQNTTAQLGLAIICQDTQKLAEAIQRMSDLIEAHPDEAEYYSVRASMYVEHNQPELAILDLDRAIELHADNANYFLARAYLHQQQGNKHSARQDFERATQLGASPAQLH